MYSKLSTRAIVLKTDDVGEKDILLSLFTREFGFVYAKASGVRVMTSRLRFALQSMSLCFVSLVHGKTGWKLTNATFLNSYYFESYTQNQKHTVANILLLLGRLYIGEEPAPDLFDLVEETLNSITGQKLSVEDVRTLEIFMVYKILEKLGHIEHNKILKPLQQTDTYSQQLSAYIKESQKLITPFLNTAIRSSGL